MNTAPIAQAVPQQAKPRYGCFPAKIGAMFAHRLGETLRLRSGRTLRAGMIVHLDVQDITRHPQADGHTKWICQCAHCAGKTWPTKKALVADHLPNKDLEKQEEVHCFYAVAHVPAVEARPEKKDKAGAVVEEAVDAQPATLLLLSDEE